MQHLVVNSTPQNTWETLKAENGNVRRAQAAAISTPQPMDLSAYGAQELDALQKSKSRGKGNDNSKPMDNLSKRSMLGLLEDWSLEERLLVQRGDSQA